MGQTTTESDIAPYMVLKKGETIFLSDTEFAVDLSGNNLKLTSVDDPDYIVEYIFTK